MCVDRVLAGRYYSFISSIMLVLCKVSCVSDRHYLANRSQPAGRADPLRSKSLPSSRIIYHVLFHFTVRSNKRNQRIYSSVA